MIKPTQAPQSTGTEQPSASTPRADDWLAHDPLGFDQDYAEDEPLDDTPETMDAQTQSSTDDTNQYPHPIKITPATLSLVGKRQLILDTETTGFSFKDGDRVIEIGVIEMINRKLTGSSLHVYLNPERLVGDSERIHGLSDAFLADKPLFADIAQPLNEYLQHAELIAHNASFDMGFLEGEFAQAGFPPLKSHVQVTDTLALAKKKHPGQKNSLDALAKRYDIVQRDRTFHGALLDAEILADVYLAMTGGQVALDIGQSHANLMQQSRQQQVSQTVSLPVIHASATEQQAHDEWVTQFEQKHGTAPIWANTTAIES